MKLSGDCHEQKTKFLSLSRFYPTYKYNQMTPDELKEYFNFIIEWYKKWFMK